MKLEVGKFYKINDFEECIYKFVGNDCDRAYVFIEIDIKNNLMTHRHVFSIIADEIDFYEITEWQEPVKRVVYNERYVIVSPSSADLKESYYSGMLKESMEWLEYIESFDTEEEARNSMKIEHDACILKIKTRCEIEEVINEA